MATAYSNDNDFEHTRGKFFRDHPYEARDAQHVACDIEDQLSAFEERSAEEFQNTHDAVMGLSRAVGENDRHLYKAIDGAGYLTLCACGVGLVSLVVSSATALRVFGVI